MAYPEEYPRCGTLTEQSVKDDEIQSLFQNGKNQYYAKKSVDQWKFQNGELGNKGKDPDPNNLDHSPGKDLHYVPSGKHENRALVNENGHNEIADGNNDESHGHYQPNGTSDGHNHSSGTTNGKSGFDEEANGAGLETSQTSDPTESDKAVTNPRESTYLRGSHGIVETDSLTSDVLSDLFNDKICVLCIKKYASAVVCEKLDSFLREKGSEQYTHEIRNNGRADLIYFGVNRFGYPLNSSYNDPTGYNFDKYLSKALPTIRSIRQAAHPYLSPIDKFRVEMDEAWHKNVNVASLQGQKTFCGIGRIMPASLSELSEVQPHFDAVPTSYFPQIHKQFTANFYLNVPETGGELEIWDVPPISIDNIENFTIPNDWRGVLPKSIKVKPERGDLLMFNTRRPHAITSFGGSNPRTSVQTFIGLAKNSEVFLWV